VSDLRSFAVLQARVFEFLERQDEDTLRSIVDGTAQLTVAGAPEQAPHATQAPPAGHAPPRPSDDPFQVVQDLPKLASVEDRRNYLRATRLKRSGLKEVARLLGVRRYSSLRVGQLIDVLAGADDTGEPEPPAPVPARQTPARAPQATAETPPPPAPTAEVTAIATKLRETETEEEGAEYLTEQRLARDDLLAVAAELGLTRVNRLPQTELEKRVLKQAIGARRKFAGLRKW
jgi:hypothetical protein